MTNTLKKLVKLFTGKRQEVTAVKLIETRESLISMMKDYWYKIYKFNVIPTGMTPDFDLAKIYKEINSASQELLQTKLAIQAMNMGLKSMKDLPENNLYSQIYLLSQLKEHKVKLEKLPTKKGEKENIVLTEAFVAKELKSVNAELIRVQGEIDAWNAKSIFIIE